jgi:hypothetical protein
MRATTTRFGTDDDDDDARFETDATTTAKRRGGATTTTTTTETRDAEALTRERSRLVNAVKHLERSCEALEEAAADDATTRADKETYEDALRENARAISRHQGEIYALTVEIERRAEAKAEVGDANAREGRWV